MADHWVNYQAALGLVVGVNLALVALPSLGQPSVEAEVDRWKATCGSFPIDHEQHFIVNKKHNEFDGTVKNVTLLNSYIILSCYLVSFSAVLLLIFATFSADDQPIYWLVILVLMAGAAPSGAFWALNLWTNSQIRRFAKHRQEFDKVAFA